MLLVAALRRSIVMTVVSALVLDLECNITIIPRIILRGRRIQHTQPLWRNEAPMKNFSIPLAGCCRTTQAIFCLLWHVHDGSFVSRGTTISLKGLTTLLEIKTGLFNFWNNCFSFLQITLQRGMVNICNPAFVQIRSRPVYCGNIATYGTTIT